MKLFKLASMFLMMFIAAFAFVACNGNAEDKTVTLTFWNTYSDPESTIFNNEVVPAFEAANPNIKIESIVMPYDGLKQQVISGAISGTGPDVMRMDITWVPEFASLGALQSLSGYDEFATLKDKFFSGPMSTNYYNGEYYGVPLNTNTKVAIYSNEMMQELGITAPPKTFDDLVSYKDQLGQGQYLIGISGASSWGLLPYFWSLGGRVTNDDYSVASGYINSTESISALSTLVDWYNQEIIGPSILGEEPGTWGGIDNDQYLLIDDGPWYYGAMGDETTTPALLPSGDGGSISVVGGEDLVMLSGSENKDAAWTFIQFMSTVETQLMLAEAGLIPTLSEAANSENAMTEPYMQAYLEQLITAFPRTPSKNWGSIDELLSNAFESAFRGEKTAAEALNDVAPLIDAQLN